MAIKGFKTNRGDTGTIRAQEFKTGRPRKITPHLYAQSSAYPGGAPRPHWLGSILSPTIRRPERPPR